jgi:hypothetical protein
MLSGISNELIIMQNLNGYYQIGGNGNTIQTWEIGSGYFIKLNDATTLELAGYCLEEKSLTIQQDWNILLVRWPCEVQISDLLDQSEYIIIYEGIGTKINWPEKDVFTLEALSPGNAYLIKVEQEKTLTFPDCE